MTTTSTSSTVQGHLFTRSTVAPISQRHFLSVPSVLSVVKLFLLSKLPASPVAPPPESICVHLCHNLSRSSHRAKISCAFAFSAPPPDSRLLLAGAAQSVFICVHLWLKLFFPTLFASFASKPLTFETNAKSAKSAQVCEIPSKSPPRANAPISKHPQKIPNHWLALQITEIQNQMFEWRYKSLNISSYRSICGHFLSVQIKGVREIKLGRS